MPPTVENIATLIAKRDIAIESLDELYKEFNMLYQVEPQLIALENVRKEILVKKQQTTIAERLIDCGETESAEMSANKQIGHQVKQRKVCCRSKEGVTWKGNRQMIKTTIAESAYKNTIQTFVKNQTGRRATNAQEDIISLFTMRHLFQLIPLGILKLHQIQTPEVLGHWAETQASTLNIQQVRNVPGTGYPDAFVDIHVISESPVEPIAKRIVLDGTCTGRHDKTPSISVLCTCKGNELKEIKFIKSIADSTEMVVGRVQVQIPWSEDGPP
ncbi:hypothetical protein P5673_004091 [Acropora cervicornis]|uniref:Uncharacterized protein n=1 Tax=Acropora cervicornis TaxID=6130 RepID=A0AAD9VED3_ACRCE|nr:hypothetical protein P5673_004091 [Acropora cervicornis]